MHEKEGYDFITSPPKREGDDAAIFVGNPMRRVTVRLLRVNGKMHLVELPHNAVACYVRTLPGYKWAGMNRGQRADYTSRCRMDALSIIRRKYPSAQFKRTDIATDTVSGNALIQVSATHRV